MARSTVPRKELSARARKQLQAIVASHHQTQSASEIRKIKQLRKLLQQVIRQIDLVSEHTTRRWRQYRSIADMVNGAVWERLVHIRSSALAAIGDLESDIPASRKGGRQVDSAGRNLSVAVAMVFVLDGVSVAKTRSGEYSRVLRSLIEKADGRTLDEDSMLPLIKHGADTVRAFKACHSKRDLAILQMSDPRVYGHPPSEYELAYLKAVNNQGRTTRRRRPSR